MAIDLKPIDESRLMALIWIANCQK